MMKSYTLPALLAFLFVITGCKKDDVCKPVENIDKAFIIIPDKSYMPANKIDSALLHWEANGKKQVVKMEFHHDTLSVDMKALQEGEGKLKLEIFSRIKFQNQYSSVWVEEKQVTIKHNESVNIAGPSSFNDPQWLPRVQLADAVGHSAVVALRPDDPYFMVKNVGPAVLKVIVGRMYWRTKGGVSAVAGKEWECKTGCLDQNRDIINTNFFTGLPAQIGNRTWDHIDIAIVYEQDKWGGGFVLSLNHTLN